MTLAFDKQIPDDLSDDVGQCLRRLHALPRWTAQKFEVYKEFEQLAERHCYLTFVADYRDYYLERKGQSCLYDVPKTQRGALAKLAGKRIRLVCGGAYNPYSRRLFFAKEVA